MFVVDDLMLAAFAEAAPEMFAAEALGAEAIGTALGAEALMGLGAEALGTSAVGGAEAVLGADAMAANAAAGGAGAGGAGVNAAQVAAQQEAATQAATRGLASVPQAAPNVITSPVSGFQPTPGFEGITSGPQGASPGFFNPSAAPGQGPMQYQLSAPNASQGLRLGTGLESIGPSAPITSVLQPPSALDNGMAKAMKFAKEYPGVAMTGAYMGANALGLLKPTGATFNDKPYDGPLSRYKLSPNFQGSTVNPLDFQYTPKRYAGGGGIMGAESYDIPVGYEEGGPVALPLPSRTMRSSDAFQVPGQSQDPSQFAAADAYNDILRNRVIADTQTGRANDPMYNIADARRLETRANTPERGFGPMIAGNELLKRSNEGEFAAPGYGDLGQFAGSFDAANVPMGDNRFSPVDQYKMIARDASIVDGTASIMPRDGGRAAMANLSADSADGRFAVPGYGDLGQFAGGDGGGGMGGGSLGKYYDDMSASAYAKGGSLSDSISEYQKMLSGQPQAAPAASRDVGIYYDQDPDTRYQDALTAAQIRQSKVNQRAYVSAPAAKRPTPLGKLNLPTSAKSKDSSGGDVEAASGGIMQSSLGGYAAGGNPRLLKGPGDGMSDNIPATINGRQPARLADGEFVIPADVVSHLGNGSTDAGAKHLHAMMDKVRKARTGNPKQGKQIKPQKYMPK